MPAASRRRPRRALLLGAALTGTAVLAGCGAQQASGGTAETSVAPVASAAPAPSGTPSGAPSADGAHAGLAGVDDLAAGLLPAEALGADTVTTLTAEELAQQLQQYRGPLAGALPGLTVTPESCRSALAALQPAAPQPGDLTGFAAQHARIDGGPGTTVEVLATGPVVADAVEQARAAVTACPEATVTAPRLGSVTVALETLDDPAVGDAAAALRVTATLTRAGGQPLTVPALVGLVQDGDRLVTLVSGGPGAAPDEAAFVDLLERAHRHQADALD